MLAFPLLKKCYTSMVSKIHLEMGVHLVFIYLESGASFSCSDRFFVPPNETATAMTNSEHIKVICMCYKSIPPPLQLLCSIPPGVATSWSSVVQVSPAEVMCKATKYFLLATSTTTVLLSVLSQSKNILKARSCKI